MPRALLALFVGALSLSLISNTSLGWASGTASVVAEADSTNIVALGREGDHGAWRRYLWLKLKRSQVTSFTVCAIWKRSSPPPPNCRSTRGTRLPQGTTLRLEQRRVTPSLAPGWRTVGVSTEAAIQAVLSNGVSGNRAGTIAYRVTLRSASGRIRKTSNTFRVYWITS